MTITNKKWWKKAGIRSIKTMAQTASATIGSTALLSQVDWKLALSATILAGIASLLTSIKGLPELDCTEGAENEL